MASKMRTEKKILLAFISLALFVGCYKQKDNRTIRQSGFIVFDNPNYWHFVPVESIDTANCFSSLKSNKFGKGFQFNPSGIPNVSYIQRTLDTLSVKNLETGYLNVSPVEVEFTFSPQHYELYTSERNDPKWNFKYSVLVDSGLVGNDRIEFIYNIFPVNILDVTPLFCLNKKEADISECGCMRRENDPDDYLVKICHYLKATDRYTDLPCRYDLKKISMDTLDGKTVTKVELTCCYLGDVAYFDRKTKELLTISYGAK